MGMTITEALSEINLIKKKIAAKNAVLANMVARASHQKDQYEKHGGSEKIFSRENQSVQDLHSLLVSIRTEIAKANLENFITIDGQIKSIFGWLTWRREVYDVETQAIREQLEKLQQISKVEEQRPQVHKNDKGEMEIVTYIRNVDEKELRTRLEQLENIHGKLDGLLSLKNAQIVLKV
jgi:hypothetical protein